MQFSCESKITLSQYVHRSASASIKDSSITRAQEAWVVGRKDVRQIDGHKKKREAVNIFKVMYLRCTTESYFQTIAMTYGSKTSIINDDNWVDSVFLVSRCTNGFFPCVSGFTHLTKKSCNLLDVLLSVLYWRIYVVLMKWKGKTLNKTLN